MGYQPKVSQALEPIIQQESNQGFTVQTGDLRSISTGATIMVRDRHMLIRGLMEFAGQVYQLATGQEVADA